MLFWVNGFGDNLQSIRPFGLQLSAASLGILEMFGQLAMSIIPHRSPWKGIIQVLPTFHPLTKLSLGCGSSIHFWLEPWICSSSLDSRYPRLYNLSVLKDGFIPNFFSPPSNWNLHLRRNLTELKNLRIFLAFSISFSPRPVLLTPEFGPFPLPVPFLSLLHQLL